MNYTEKIRAIAFIIGAFMDNDIVEEDKEVQKIIDEMYKVLVLNGNINMLNKLMK